MRDETEDSHEECGGRPGHTRNGTWLHLLLCFAVWGKWVCVFTAERWLIVYTDCISHLQCMRPEYFFRSHYLPYISMLNYSYIELFGLAELRLKLKSIAAAAARCSVARQWPSISWACVLKYLSRCQSGLAAVPPRVERCLHFTKMEDKCQYVSIFHTPDRASDPSWWTVFPFTFKIKWHLKMQQAIKI